MRDRLLIRHFLWRFLEHDLVSPNADRHGILSAVGGTLAAVSLFMAVLVAWYYQFSNTMPPGLTSLRSLDDRFLFISSSMLVMALAAVAQWDALVLDARDAAVLGVLPISEGGDRPHQVRRDRAVRGSRGRRVESVSRRSCARRRCRSVSASGSRARHSLTLAHAVASRRGGRFRLSRRARPARDRVRDSGADRFRKISAALQASLIVMLTTALLLLPGVSGVAKQWRSDGRAARMLPPSWFVGLHETLAGSVIDGVPRARPARTSDRTPSPVPGCFARQRPTQAKSATRPISIAPCGRFITNWPRLPLPRCVSSPLSPPSRACGTAGAYRLRRTGLSRRAGR